MLTYGEYVEKCEVLTQWAKLYDAGSSEAPTDDVYDAVYRELKEYEMYNPDMVLESSPTRRVIGSGTSDDGFPKVKHDPPMISIANSNGIDEAVEWVSSMAARGVKTVELEYKLDGCSLAVVYNDGKINDAITRGTDNIGDSVAANALQIAGIPHTIPAKGLREVRGEVLWNFEDFDAYNEELIEAGKKALVNPRNGAAGTLKLHDPNEVGHRKLSYVAYIVARGSDFDTQEEDVKWLEEQGFVVPPHHTVSIENGTAEFARIAEEMRSKRYELPYPIDGIVIKVNDKSWHSELGYTAKTPNFYRAYKFPPEEKETELIDIEQSIGMSGAITPVAIVKPVSLAMTTVQRCSLHNWDLVDYLGLYKGCTVTIRKAGEIIPELVKSDTGMSKDDYKILSDAKKPIPVYSERLLSHRIVGNKNFYKRPDVCPFCGGKLHNATNADGVELVAWICDNPDCDAQLGNRINNFGARTTMNIKGLGESIIQALLDEGKIHDYTDLYKFTVADLDGIGNLRAKGAKKIIDAINNTRKNYLHQLIEGFSIPGIGHHASKPLAHCVDGVGGLMAIINDHASYDKFIEDAYAAGITRVLATKFADWLIAHAEVVKYFCDNNIAQTVQPDTTVSAKLAGKNCIMTGTFDKLARDVFKKMVVDNGGKVCSGISKNTNIVLLGDAAGPNKIKAINDLVAAGVKIDIYTPSNLSEFLAILE